ncbi:hypothetical protein ACT2CV_06945 [Pasteurellaceae bacterium 22721_9_1]
MTFKSVVLSLLLLPTMLWAQWQPVGKTDYNWGPFLVYTIALHTETGNYQENERPLMLTFTYDKQVEGKNFAVSLIKELENFKIEADTEGWLKELQRIFPDFSPNDKLSYIALEDKGYFVLNDTVLDYEFDQQFNQAFIDIWLSPQTKHPKMRANLIDKSKNDLQDAPTKPTQDAVPLHEEEINPQLPPEYQIQNPDKRVS